MANITYDLYEILERKLGKEEAKEEKEIVKIQIREELKEELATKEDILLVKKDLEIIKQELMGRIEVMEWKIKLWFLIVIALILLTNKDVFEWLIKFLNFFK